MPIFFPIFYGCFNNLYFCFLDKVEMKCYGKVTKSFNPLLYNFAKEEVKLQMKDWSTTVGSVEQPHGKTPVLRKIIIK